MKDKRFLSFACLVFLLLFSTPGKSQKSIVLNMPRYDDERFHFGFVLGGNMSYLTIRPIANMQQVSWDSTYLPDVLAYGQTGAKVLSIESRPTPGFVISIVSAMRIGRLFNLRFIPSLSFGDRDLVYSILVYRGTGHDTTLMVTKKVPSTYINFPLEIKYKALRYNNFRPYLLAGAQYTLDLASQAKKRERSSDQKIVKFNQNDLYIEAGVGFDFYNEWFKMGIEVKMMYGIANILKYEHNIYTDPIAKLSSKIFQLSFTFE